MTRRYPHRERTAGEILHRAFVFMPPWAPPVAALGALLGIGLGVPALLHTDPGPWWEIGVIAALILLVAGFRAMAERRHRNGRLATARRLGDLQAMRWSEFEQLVEDAYRRQGWHTDRTGGRGSDGGVDILLRRHGVVRAVQCKKWTTDVVRVKDVRELQGALADHGAHAGIYVTAGRFTADAVAFAQRRGMELVDGPALLALLASVRPSGAPVPAHTVEPGVSEPSCPRCDAGLVVRVNPTTGNRFLGCSRFPSCHGSRSL